MIKKPCCSRFSLHKFVHLKFFWTQFKNVHLGGPCSLRPCISRPYCTYLQGVFNLCNFHALFSETLSKLGITLIECEYCDSFSGSKSVFCWDGLYCNNWLLPAETWLFLFLFWPFSWFFIVFFNCSRVQGTKLWSIRCLGLLVFSCIFAVVLSWDYLYTYLKPKTE